MREIGAKWSELVVRSGLASSWDGGVDPLITAVVEDSRQVQPGTCFVALHGGTVDGHAFIPQALEAGASAVVSERPVVLPPTVAGLRLDRARGAAGRLAGVLHGLDVVQREGRLKLVGVTGTNGKSTFCYLLREILRAAGHPTAMLGTVQYDLVGRTIEATMTTPPAATLVGYLAEAVRAGATHAVMEVSSHALDQGRCDGLRFDVGVFSNLTGDHLDYHKDMASYLRAKKLLFDGLDASASAVVNWDVPCSEEIVADCPARLLRYGIVGADSGRQQRLQIAAEIREISARGTRFALRVAADGYGESCREIDSPLTGRHNVQNSLAAVGAAVSLGIEPDVIAAGLLAAELVPGRLQRVLPLDEAGAPQEGDTGFTVLVDYAHTDDALENVLSSLKPLTERDGSRLIVLFGCGGDRDRTKRARMAVVAEKWADRVVVTSDNPRTEDPLSIIGEIMRGFSGGRAGRVSVEPDRRKAIVEAISLAEPRDIVLLAGKGHEDYQILGREKIWFDDAVIAGKLLGERLAQAGREDKPVGSAGT